MSEQERKKVLLFDRDHFLGLFLPLPNLSLGGVLTF